MTQRGQFFLKYLQRYNFRRVLPASALCLLILTGFVSAPGICQRGPDSPSAFAITENFQSTLDTFQQNHGFPGATAAFVLQNGTSGAAATGFADVEAGTPMTPQSRMLSASIGKSFAGAAAVALAREGVLDLDDPVSRWLGDRAWFRRLPNHEAITLRHLLNHSSGLPDHVHLKDFAAEVSRRWKEKDNPFPPEALIGFVLDMPPLFEAGTGWAYTDTGYILVGLVIEAATGKACFDEITSRFLIPLGLTLTTPADRRWLPGLAAGYMAADNMFGFPAKTTRADGAMHWNPAFEWAGGGLVSNSLDLARWGTALFGGKAMAGAYLDELLNAVPVSRDTADIRYGAGVAIYRQGPLGPVYGHGGWIPGYTSSLRHYPDHGVTIAFQINTDIGLADSSMPLVAEMEMALAKAVMGMAGAHFLSD